MKNKVKAFYQKHECKINIAALALVATGLLVLSNKSDAPSISSAKNVDDLDDEEWDHLVDMGRAMDEYVAERRALKNQT